jgi:hypothetical protein
MKWKYDKKQWKINKQINEKQNKTENNKIIIKSIEIINFLKKNFFLKKKIKIKLIKSIKII